MANIKEAQKSAIDFLLSSIDKPWDFQPADNDPLRFEAHVYLANKGQINKKEWGEKINKIWDRWINTASSSLSPTLPKGKTNLPRNNFFGPL